MRINQEIINIKKRLPLINSKDKQFLQIFFKKVPKNDKLQSEIEHNIEIMNDMNDMNDVNSKMNSYFYSKEVKQGLKNNIQNNELKIMNISNLDEEEKTVLIYSMNKKKKAAAKLNIIKLK